MGYRCRNCGAAFEASGDLPIFLPQGFELPVSGAVVAAPQVHGGSNGAVEIFRPVDEDPEIFMQLRRSAIPTMSFIPRTCRRRVAKCYAEAVKAVNEVPDDLNRWGLMQIFVVSILRSVGKEDRGEASLSELVAHRLMVWEGGGEGQRCLWREALSSVVASPRRVTVFSEEDQRKVNVKRCRKLANLGRLGDAARALVSKGILSDSREVLDELARKHPFARPPAGSADRPTSSLRPSWEGVLRAL